MGAGRVLQMWANREAPNDIRLASWWCIVTLW